MIFLSLGVSGGRQLGKLPNSAIRPSDPVYLYLNSILTGGWHSIAEVGNFVMEAIMPRKTHWENAPAEQQKIDELKRELCWTLRRSMARIPHATLAHLAIRLQTSRASVSRVQTGKIDALTVNQLIRYLVRLEPQFKFLISI